MTMAAMRVTEVKIDHTKHIGMDALSL